MNVALDSEAFKCPFYLNELTDFLVLTYQDLLCREFLLLTIWYYSSQYGDHTYRKDLYPTIEYYYKLGASHVCEIFGNVQTDYILSVSSIA